MSPKRHATRAVIYVRQSLDRTGEGLAVERQREACEKLCAERGWTVLETITDNDLSASNGKPRPGYTRLLERAAAAELDVIVVWHVDRLVRRLADLERVIEVCERSKVRLATVSGDLDLSNDAGRLVGRILASVARGEVERKGARQRLALDQAAKAGKPVSFAHRSFGYLPDRVTPHPVEGLAVRDACRALAAGASLAGIARQWNEDGLATPQGAQRWRYQTVKAVLRNPRVAGLRERNGELYTGTWTPLVDRELWEAVLRVVNDPSRAQSKRVRTLLSGIARCHCGAPVSGARNHYGTPIYRCRDLPGGGGGHVARLAEPINALVSALVVERLSRDDARDLLVDRSRPNVEQLHAEVVAVNARLEELAEQRIDDVITPAQLRAGTERAKARLVILEAALADADRLAVLGPLVNANDVAEAWARLDLDRQRAVVDLLMEITLQAPGMGRRIFDPETVEITWKTT